MPDQSWESIVDPLNDANPPDSQEKDALDWGKITKGLIAFWKISLNQTSDKSDKAVFKTATQDSLCSALSDGIDAILKITNQEERVKSLRRIQSIAVQSAGIFQENDIGIRRMLSQMFLWYANNHKDKIQILTEDLVNINPHLANYVGQSATKLSLAARLLNSANSPFALPSAKQLALPSPNQDSPTSKAKQKPEIGNHELIGQVVDLLINSDFRLEVLLDKDPKGGLQKLLMSVIAMVKQTGLEYAVHKDSEIRRSLQRFGSPIRTKDLVVNVTANILYHQSPTTQRIIKVALTELGQNDAKNFGPLFEVVIGFVSQKETAQQPAVPPAYIPSETKPATTPSPPPVAPRVSGSEKSLRDAVKGLSPFDRLCTLYKSGKVDTKRAAGLPKYCHEILCLIICGQSDPAVEALDKGYKEWMHLVHPDKKPSELMTKLAGTITEIGRLTRREPDPRLGAQALEKIFAVLSELYINQSATVIPQKGTQRIVFGSDTVASLLVKENFTADKIKVIVNASLLSKEKWETTKINPGDVLEVIVLVSE